MAMKNDAATARRQQNCRENGYFTEERKSHITIRALGTAD